MVSFSGFIHLIHIALLMNTTISQNILCVWNAEDPWHRLNGEYELQSDTLYNNQPSWTQDNTSCSNRGTIFAVQYGFLYYWAISATTIPHTSQIDDIPICSANGAPYTLPNTPTACDVGYHANQQLLSLTITTGTCPSSLSCTTLQITSTSNTCNGIYETEATQHAIYKQAATNSEIYFYFNPHTYTWYCAQNHAIHSCNDSQSMQHSVMSSRYHEWNDFQITASFTLQMIDSNDDSFDAQLLCLDTKPTVSVTSTSASIVPGLRKLPKMQRAIGFVVWYLFGGLVCVSCCVLIALRPCIRSYRSHHPVPIKPKQRGTSIIITPPQRTNPSLASEKKLAKKSTVVSSSNDSNETGARESVNYGRYNEDYQCQETLKLTENKTKTIEMQQNALFIVKAEEDEDIDDNGGGSPMETLTTLTEDTCRVLQTPSTTAFPPVKNMWSTTVQPTRNTITMESSYDDIYGKYEPEKRKATLSASLTTSPHKPEGRKETLPASLIIDPHRAFYQ